MDGDFKFCPQVYIHNQTVECLRLSDWSDFIKLFKIKYETWKKKINVKKNRLVYENSCIFGCIIE